MQTTLYNQSGKEVGTIELPDGIFGLSPKQELIHQALVAQQANRRQAIAHTKGRGEVRGGGKKPWRQKGTGRARHGSIRSPIWKGGGVTFGPTNQKNFFKKINKKMKQKALFMALSSKVKSSCLIVLDSITLEKGKTKEAAGVLKAITPNLKGYTSGKSKSDSIMIVLPIGMKREIQALRNISFARPRSPKSLNIEDILSSKYLLLTKDSLSQIRETYKR